ncbi:hypothetical protein AVEN_158927-1 [Araneus ventricosus]|uniref:Uncharacterized protein n=1 Tax=Araneus ventricosus TaxID=182803 RepID=A0A4Y2BC02_ARAVE|nr:hypothetical protein AVEN_158927-1 [Araneus ventricosus]
MMPCQYNWNQNGSYLLRFCQLSKLNIPRYILFDYALKIELHGFAHASEKAYGAAIYIKCLNNSAETPTNLLCSKSRIAPLKSVTISRLELCDAVLLAKLARKAITSMKISFHSTVLWTDFTIVLVWMKRTLRYSNRVSAIQNLAEVNAWKHVPSQENPADTLYAQKYPDTCRFSHFLEFLRNGLTDCLLTSDM